MNNFEDLSGISTGGGGNPYQALISACNDNADDIQAVYSKHREARNAQQREKLLSPDFKELIIDQTLLRLEKPEVEPGFKDPRNCLVVWARPPEHVIQLAAQIQAALREVSPSLWLMPPQRMHMTTLEVAFSRTPPEIAALVDKVRPRVAELANFTFTHRARLVKPMISYDLSAFALSLVPASGETIISPDTVPLRDGEKVHDGDSYTYHHLRRDIYDLARSMDLPIDSRYVVPSAHITLGRHLTQDDHQTPVLRQKWIDTIERINKRLQSELWDRLEGKFPGEWIVGQERGLDVRAGVLWYGNGRTIMVGEGF